MIITEEIKRIIRETPFLSLVTLDPEGNPHPIIAGKGEVSGDTIEFGIYKMEKTQANLRNNKNAWVIGATRTEEKPKGIRLIGTAAAQDKKLIFTPVNAENLL